MMIKHELGENNFYHYNNSANKYLNIEKRNGENHK